MSEEKKELVGVGNMEVEMGSNPADLIKLAVTGGADLEKLSTLLDIQERWEANQAKKAYVVAMAAFKANPPEISKDKTVNYGEGKASYKHASLANITDKINSALSEHGLSAAWQTQQNGAVSITCKITHKLGHSEETTLSAGADTSGNKNSIQAIGSTITYLQRYTLLCLTGLAAGDMDDDGRSSEPADYIDEKQLSQIRDYVDDESKGINKGGFLKYMGIESIDKMPKADYAKAMAMFKQRDEQKGAKK